MRSLQALQERQVQAETGGDGLCGRRLPEWELHAVARPAIAIAIATPSLQCYRYQLRRGLTRDLLLLSLWLPVPKQYELHLSEQPLRLEWEPVSGESQ